MGFPKRLGVVSMCSVGLHIGSTYRPQQQECVTSQQLRADFKRFTAFRNSQHGASIVDAQPVSDRNGVLRVCEVVLMLGAFWLYIQIGGSACITIC